MYSLTLSFMTDTNKYARKQIAAKWPSLSEDERVQLRSLWARAGVQCSVCGQVGYYREICPKGCLEPRQKKRKTFDSDSSSDDDVDETRDGPINAALSFGTVSEFTSAASGARGYVNDTGLGVLWGAPGVSNSSSVRHAAVATSGLTHKQQYLADMRPRAQEQQKRLAASDASIGSFEFFTKVRSKPRINRPI